jgi:glutathione S-transferase
MKLYYSAGSCSTSCHIVLEESGLKYQTVSIDWDQSSDPNVAEVLRMNPLGTLPVMKTDEGKLLSQNIAIQTYIADQAPEKKLLPPPNTLERAEAINWLSYVAADLHKSFSPLFSVSSMSENQTSRNDFKKWAMDGVTKNLQFLDQSLQGKDYLTGKNFTVADAYCFVVLSWTQWLEVPITPYPNIQAYLTRMSQRPSVQKVLKEEGLLD